MTLDQAHRVETQWGPASIEEEDLAVLSDFTGYEQDECIARLTQYRTADMANAWRQHDPRSAAEIHSFYANTDLYLWELLAWNASPAYAPYLAKLARLADVFPPETHPRAVDYGCGIGTAALSLAALGYRVTVADIPGKTFDFAKARLARRGIAIEALDVIDRAPVARASYDVLVSFDVLEHVEDPAKVARDFVAGLRLGGGAAVVASFGGEGTHPHHLAAGVERFRGHRWYAYFETVGMRSLGDGIYRKVGTAQRLLLVARYKFWRATGLHVQRLER